MYRDERVIFALDRENVHGVDPHNLEQSLFFLSRYRREHFYPCSQSANGIVHLSSHTRSDPTISSVHDVALAPELRGHKGAKVRVSRCSVFHVNRQALDTGYYDTVLSHDVLQVLD